MNRGVLILAGATLLFAAGGVHAQTDTQVQSAIGIDQSTSCLGDCFGPANPHLSEHRSLRIRALTLLNNASIQLERGNIERAAALFALALRQHPDDPRFQYLAGGAHFLSGNFAEARPLLKSASQSPEFLSSDQLRIANEMIEELDEDGTPNQSLKTYDTFANEMVGALNLASRGGSRSLLAWN